MTVNLFCKHIVFIASDLIKALLALQSQYLHPLIFVAMYPEQYLSYRELELKHADGLYFYKSHDFHIIVKTKTLSFPRLLLIASSLQQFVLDSNCNF
jgi:hypothetical protein